MPEKTMSSSALQGISLLNQAILCLKLSKHCELHFRTPNYSFLWVPYQCQETFPNPRLVKQGVEKDPLVPYNPSDKMDGRSWCEENLLGQAVTATTSKSLGISVLVNVPN